MQPRSASVSLALHTAAVIAMWFLGAKVGAHVAKPKPVVLRLFYKRSKPAEAGGGSRNPLPPSRGRPPSRPATRIFVPPMMTASMPKLAVSAGLIDAPVDPRIEPVGDPLGRPGLFSGGPGGPGGIGGPGCCGAGPSTGSRVGGAGPPVEARRTARTTPPRLIHKVDPEYPDEARKSRYEGVVVLSVEIDPAGRPSRIRVMRSLGLGLDERASEAVNQWRFQPAMNSGQPVTANVVVEVSFRLL